MRAYRTTRIIAIARTAAYASIVVLCLTLAWFTYRLTTTLEVANRTLAQTTMTVQEAGKVLKDSKNVLAAEQKYIATDLPVTLKHLDQSIVDFDNLLVSVQGTSRETGLTISQMRIDEVGLAAQIGHDEAELARQGVLALQTTQTTVAGLQPLESNASSAVAQLNTRLADPNIPEILANANKTAASVSSMADDTQKYWHNLLHPSWPRRIYNAVTGLGIDAAKVFIP